MNSQSDKNPKSCGLGKWRWLSVVGGILGLSSVAVVGGWMFVSHASGLNRSSAIDSTVEWARLRELPVTKAKVHVEVEGSPFTRQFRVTFQDNPSEVRAWLSRSPGPASVRPATDPDGWRVYRYRPGGGAAFSRVRVSPSGKRVVIDVSWS